jgi:dTMP kinase
LIVMNITHIPGALVRRVLQTARLPLTLAELVLRRSDDSRPALAFEAIGANVKRAVGSVLRDETLIAEGRLQEMRTAELGRAKELEAEAAQRQAAADAKLEARLEADETRRAQAKLEASEKLEAAAQDRHRKEQQADQEARQKGEATRNAQAASQHAVATRERAARSKKLASERKAMASARKASGAKKAVKRVDGKLTNSREARKA